MIQFDDDGQWESTPPTPMSPPKRKRSLCPDTPDILLSCLTPKKRQRRGSAGEGTPQAPKRSSKKGKAPPDSPATPIQSMGSPENHQKRSRGEVRDCPCCGMVYRRGDADDEEQHRNYCTPTRPIHSPLKGPKIKNELSCRWEALERRAAVVQDAPADPKGFGGCIEMVDRECEVWEKEEAGELVREVSSRMGYIQIGEDWENPLFDVEGEDDRRCFVCYGAASREKGKRGASKRAVLGLMVTEPVLMPARRLDIERGVLEKNKECQHPHKPRIGVYRAWVSHASDGVPVAESARQVVFDRLAEAAWDNPPSIVQQMCRPARGGQQAPRIGRALGEMAYFHPPLFVRECCSRPPHTESGPGQGLIWVYGAGLNMSVRHLDDDDEE